MKSLLSLAYTKTDISFSNLNTIYNHEIYHDIYNRVVNETRSNIIQILKNHRTRLILRTIYMLQTRGVLTMLEEICGDLTECKISLWRLAMVYSVVLIKRFKTKKERIDTIIEHIDMILLTDDPHISKIYKCIDKIKECDENNLNLYIDTYMAFGSRIKY